MPAACRKARIRTSRYMFRPQASKTQRNTKCKLSLDTLNSFLSAPQRTPHPLTTRCESTMKPWDLTCILCLQLQSSKTTTLTTENSNIIQTDSAQAKIVSDSLVHVTMWVRIRDY